MENHSLQPVAKINVWTFRLSAENIDYMGVQPHLTK
jgi:hypothetical protein